MGASLTPITSSLVEEIRLAVRHRPGSNADAVDLEYLQRLVRAGADPQAGMAALCDPAYSYCDASMARVAQWLITLPQVQPLAIDEFARALRAARGQDFFQVCLQGLAERGQDTDGCGGNVLHALVGDGAIMTGVSAMLIALDVLAPFPEVARSWLRQPSEDEAGATPAHLVWRRARAALIQHQENQERLRDHSLLMSGSLQVCTVKMAHAGADYAQLDDTGAGVFGLVRRANANGLGELAAPPWGTWDELVVLLERFQLHQATQSSPERGRAGPRL